MVVQESTDKKCVTKNCVSTYYSYYQQIIQEPLTPGRASLPSPASSPRRLLPKQPESSDASPGQLSGRRVSFNHSIERKEDVLQKQQLPRCLSPKSASQGQAPPRPVAGAVEKGSSSISRSSGMEPSYAYFSGDAAPSRLVSPGLVSCVMKCPQPQWEEEVPAAQTYTSYFSWGIKVEISRGSPPLQ